MRSALPRVDHRSGAWVVVALGLLIGCGTPALPSPTPLSGTPTTSVAPPVTPSPSITAPTAPGATVSRTVTPPAGDLTTTALPPVPADCPVTARVARAATDPNVDGFPALGWYRNAERTLWAGLAPAYRGNQWYAGPTDQKVRWWHRGRLVITGRRLDGPAPPLQVSLDGAPQGTPSPGPTVGPPPTWTPLGGSAAGILIPVAGCWELTARTPWDELRFVVYAYPPDLRGSP